MNEQLARAAIFACYAVGLYCWLQIICSIGVLLLTAIKLNMGGF